MCPTLSSKKLDASHCQNINSKKTQAYWMSSSFNAQMLVKSSILERIVTVSGQMISLWSKLVMTCVKFDRYSPRFKVKRVIPLFKRLYPGAIAEFIFDQSSAHGAFAKDALNAKEMNVQPGGKQRAMHDTRIPSDNPRPELRKKA